MIKSLKLLFLAIPFSSIVNATDFVECKFTEYMRYADGKAIDAEYYPINQYVKIIKTSTTNETLGLDGSVRAVNSDKWFIEDSYNLFYTGNRGEVLTIIKNSKSGDLFNAQLISFGVKRESITELKGICSISP